MLPENDFASMTIEQLRAERNRLEEVINDNYWRFTRCAASKCATYVKGFSEAGNLKSLIDIEIKNRTETL